MNRWVNSLIPNRSHDVVGIEAHIPRMLARHRTAKIITRHPIEAEFLLRSFVNLNVAGCVSIHKSVFSSRLDPFLHTQQFCELPKLVPFLHRDCIGRIALT